MPQTQEDRDVQEVVRAHAGWVFACAKRRVRDDALAEDVAQAAFILFWQKGSSLEVGGEVKVTGWLYRAVRYCAGNALRLKQIRQRHEREAAMAALADGSAGEVEVDWNKVSPELEWAVDRLRDEDRAAVLLRFYRQMSFAEVGESLGISEEAAKKRVQRAVEKLRGVLASKGVVAGAAALGVILAEKVTEAAPAGLVEAATAAVAGGGTGSAGVIAKGAMKMMLWTKVKVAAGVALAALATGGAGIAVITTVPQPTEETPATQPATMTAAALSEEQVVAEIEKCGGTAKRDSNAPHGLEVEFNGNGLAGAALVTDVLLEHIGRLNQLQTLGLWNGTKVTDVGVAHLRGAKTLQSLDLTGTKVTDAGLEQLRGLDQLRTLQLMGTAVTDAGLQHLKGMGQLRSLNLMVTKVTDVGLKRLEGLSQLQALYLDRSGITDAGLEHLKGIKTLQYLNLSDTTVSDAGLAHLKGLTHFKWLAVAGTKVTDAGLEHLKGLNELQLLDLSRTGVSDSGLGHLVGMNQLQKLSLNNTKVTDVGLEDLKGLTQLRWLELKDTKVTDAGLEHLVGLNQLQTLDLKHTMATGRGMKKLQESLPKCKITR